MEDLKEKLFNYDYWKDTRVEQYDVTKYDISICNKEATTKQIAHNCLGTDIKVLLSAFPDDKNKKKALEGLKYKLKHISNDKNNKFYWDHIAPRIMESQLEKLALNSEMENISLKFVNKTAKRLLEEIPSTSSTVSPPASSSSNKHTRIKRMKTSKQSRNIGPFEHDEIYLEGNNLSVGIIIKQKALEVHERYRLGLSITDHEKKIMTNGLSSLLDLSDLSCTSQKSLFKPEEWKFLVDKFNNKYKTDNATVNQFVLSTWKIVTHVITETRDIQAGKLYLYKIFSKHAKKDYFFCLKIFEHVLNLLEKHEDMLSKQNDSSDSDFLRVVWSEIFEQLFHPKSNVKITTGETTNDNSTINRKEQYNLNDENEDTQRVLGFKIDIRLIFKEKNTSIDLCAGEIANNDKDSKIISDEGKVTREAKDILDFLVDILPNSMSDNCVGWSVLIAGATCSISCLYLDANGLYVNVPKFDFSLPANFLELPTFADTLILLFTFRREIYSLADALENKLSQKLSVIHALGRQDDVQVFNVKTFWKRGTYYIPPTGVASVAPKYHFGNPPTESILQKLEKLAPKDAAIDDLGNNDKERDIDSSIAFDEFGWAKTGSHWYNRFTNEISEANPYIDEESD